ncbi:MAG: hypothetical protein AMXMBFR47_15550 [Planctomycetota bacterium]
MRIPFLTLLVAAPAGAVPLSVDLLSPGDAGFEGVPTNFRCIDVHVDLLHPPDIFAAAGLRAVTTDLGTPGPSGDAQIVYFDADPGTPGVQPGLLNPGAADRFTTSLSRALDRNAPERFAFAEAAIAGRYEPTGPVLVTLPGELNVAWFRSPPPQWNSPPDEGYIARIALDVTQVDAAGVDLADYGNWGAGPIGEAPAGATFVLLSDRVPGALAGTIAATWETQWGYWLDWGVWYVPEPATAIALAAGGVLITRGRRRR